MKTSLLLASTILCTGLVSAQSLDQKKVPTSVVSTFNSKYPKAQNTKWEKEKDNYEVSFEEKDIEQSLLLDSVGNIIETEVEIEKNQLPKNVDAYVQSHYPSKKIKEVSKITNAQGVTTFEVEIKGMDLIFDATGNFIKEVID